MSKQRPFDIVLWGVGFTGSLVAKHLAKYYPQGANSQLRFALAGRNQAKLEKVRSECEAIDPGCRHLPILLGDAEAFDSLVAITAQTKVLLSCGGPFALIGDGVVAACLKSKTDYVDITGEYPWVKSLIDRYEEEAERKQVLIVNMCGFDSIPSDIGALYTLQQAKRAFPNLLICDVEAVCTMKGGMSGGTAASIANLFASTSANRLANSLNPFYLNPNPNVQKVAWHDVDLLYPVYSKPLRTWSAPYIMAPGNARVVRRSAALLNYGPRFSYREGMGASNIIVALLIIIFHIIFITLMAIPFTRNALNKYVLPSSGQGPSAEERAKSHFKTEFVAELEDEKGQHRSIVKTRISGGDPGYDETAKMVAESAVCLALQRDQLVRKGGVLTPAAALGNALIRRLEDKGIKFELLP